MGPGEATRKTPNKSLEDGEDRTGQDLSVKKPLDASVSSHHSSAHLLPLGCSGSPTLTTRGQHLCSIKE